MHFSVATFVAASFIGLASACTQKPVGSNPAGNPITQPITTSTVTAGKPFTITWTPTTKGTVSLVLLRGPSENVIPIDCLGDNIPNTGTFTWTPSTSLEADTTHYGLQIIVTGTGQFQYSTQFGIVNPKPAHTTPKPTSSSTPHPTLVAEKSDGQVIQISDGQVQVPTTTATIPTFTFTATHLTNHTTLTSIRGTGTGTGTGAAFHNSTIILPTRPLTVPHSLQTSKIPPAATTTVIATGTGKGSSVTASTGLVPSTSPFTASPNAGARACVGYSVGGLMGLVGLFVVMGV